MTDQPVPQESPRAPIFNMPLVIALIAAGLTAVHVASLGLSDASRVRLLQMFAYVPGRIAAHFAPHAMAQHLRPFSIAQTFLADGGLEPWTAVTYALLHGSFAHLGLNLVWLIAFGAPVARRFGLARFTVFLLVATIVSAAAETIAHPYGVEPVIGASGAVSGVVAAALRFVFQPGGSLVAPQAEGDGANGSGPVAALPLASLWRNRQVTGFLVVWFVLNLLFGLFAQPLGLSDQPIAWEAHVGGFLTGLLLFSLFDPPQRATAPNEPPRDGR